MPDVRVGMRSSISPEAEGIEGKSRALSTAGEERNATMAKRNVVLILAESGPDERLLKTVASCGYQGGNNALRPKWTVRRRAEIPCRANL